MKPPRSKFKFFLRILVGLPFIAWLFTRMFWPSTILDSPEILANLYAKELCSCTFIVGQTESVCLENSRQFLKPGRVVIDRAKREVSTRVLWSVSQARYLGDREGCQIQIQIL